MVGSARRPGPATVAPPRAVLLVPRRSDGGHRDALWEWCRAWWQREQSHMPVIEGHHDHGLFNRSAAVNRAARLAGEWDVAVIIDADVICNPERVKHAVDLAHETGQLVFPHSIRKDLNPRGTARVMAGEQGSWEGFVHKRYPDMVSSVVVVPRRLWDEIGGFDETFRGWGYEDNAFASAAQTFGDGYLRLDGEVWHLWHPTAKEGRPGTQVWSLNHARGERYRTAIGNRDAIRALQAEAVGAAPDGPGIPRILHRVVPATTPHVAEDWWHAAGELHPGWQLMTHRDPLDPADWPLTSPHWKRCRAGAQLADLVRLEALWRWGGIYIDQDVQPFRSFEPLLGAPLVAAWEDPKVIPNAVMGAAPQHPAIKECLELAIKRLTRGLGVWAAGPGVTTEVLQRHADALILPPGSFYGVDYRDPDRDAKMASFDPRANPWAYGLHHYWGSWLEPERRRVPA